MATYCGQTRIIVGVEVSICRGYNRADATELCGKILMMSEEEMNNSCDRRAPAINPGPIVWVQIGLQKPHMPRPSLVVPNRGVRTRVLNWCRRRDLNPHGLRHTPLKRACLPFHHFGDRIRDSRGNREKSGTDDGSRSEVRDFRNVEPGTLNFVSRLSRTSCLSRSSLPSD